MNDSNQLIHAAETLLIDYMCLRKGEEVLITTDTATDTRVSNVIFSVAQRMGGRPLISVGPQLPFQGALADPYITKAQADLVKNCDIWVDLTWPYFAGSHAHDEAIKTQRVRYLLGGDMNAASFGRLFGQIDLDQYFAFQAEFERVFAEGLRCRITEPRGSDVSFILSKFSLPKPRYADKPGMYLPPGTCTIAPVIETVKGEIVVTHSFHEYYAPLATPVTLTVDGPIQKISGGGASKPPLERAMLRAGGGKYGSVIHFAQGMHPSARVTGTCFIEDIRAMGSDAVGLGLPWWEPGGGENHPDAVFLEQSIWVEDEKIVENGFVVGPPSLVELALPLTQKSFIS